MHEVNATVIRPIVAFWVTILCVGLTPSCNRSSDSDLERVHYSNNEHGIREDIIGYLKHGKKHGQWLTYWDGELNRLQTWKDGVRHGPDRTYADGKLFIDSYYVDGKVHGRDRTFNERGDGLIELGWWRRNRQKGIWCYWDERGRLIKIEEHFFGERGVRYDERPGGACPHTSSSVGKHHFDPDDHTYLRPYPKTSAVIRPLPDLR